MHLHLDANPGRMGSMVGWGRGFGVFRAKEGVTLHEEGNPELQNRTWSAAFDFDLLEGLHRCVAIRCCQVNCILSGRLNLF